MDSPFSTLVLLVLFRQYSSASVCVTLTVGVSRPMRSYTVQTMMDVSIGNWMAVAGPLRHTLRLCPTFDSMCEISFERSVQFDPLPDKQTVTGL